MLWFKVWLFSITPPAQRFYNYILSFNIRCINGTSILSSNTFEHLCSRISLPRTELLKDTFKSQYSILNAVSNLS